MMKTLMGPGRLLDRVAYCMKKPCKGTNIVDEPIVVRDTFPYNPASKTAPETAQRWAKDYWSSDYVPDLIERDNEPFTVTITDLHVRSEGGRAYKVVDLEMRRFDLREDQVLEVMKLAGILPGGAVPGTFVWGILGSQVRLVLVGGELHASMSTASRARKTLETKRAAGEAPTGSTLVPGHVYRKPGGSLHCFLGRCTPPLFDKLQYAFVEMPTCEEQTDVSMLDEDRVGKGDMERIRKRNELLSGWDALTWRARCTFHWIDRYNYSDRNRVYAKPIVFMASSPKFESDVGSIEPDLLDELKANAKGWHDYRRADGRGDNLYYEWARLDPVATGIQVAVRRGYLAVGEGEKARAMYRDRIVWR